MQRDVCIDRDAVIKTWAIPTGNRKAGMSGFYKGSRYQGRSVNTRRICSGRVLAILHSLYAICDLPFL